MALQKVRKAKMIALSIIESSLVLLSQDVFKWQNLQLLDFTHNNIEIINVNAFRGLEVRLCHHFFPRKDPRLKSTKFFSFNLI